ncbi:glutamate racemase [Candidatus Dependentiae bacterium]|nr:MAG: glutamate racemase [Candidatus Dependentiae bacterium]
MDIIDQHKRPIGVFDSGVGGLTVLKELQAHFPEEDFVYYADTLHVPYGNKTVEEVMLFSDMAVSWMIAHYNVKAVVIACHTSSACCAKLLQQKYSIPIIDTIQATVQAVMHHAPSSLLLLGTKRTIKSKIHQQALIDAGYVGSIFLQACPEFVPFIENGIVDGNEIEQYVKNYCLLYEAESIVYGCTHYPFIEKVIKKVVGPNIMLINPALYIVNQVYASVKKETNKQKGSVYFHVTGNYNAFMYCMNQLLNK